MASSIEFLPLLILIAATHSLASPFSNQVMNVPLSSTSSSLTLVNPSSVDDEALSVNTTQGGIRCDGQRFGYHLPKASCEEVWRKIPTDSEVFTFGARHKGDFERPLPYRYLSSKFNVSASASRVLSFADFASPGDGLCAVDVNHMNSVVQDTASNIDISVATKALLEKCVFVETRGPRPRVPVGGIISNVGWYIVLSSPQRLKA